MKEINRKTQGISTFGQQLFLTVGLVKNNADPAHHGRLQIFCPSIDSQDFEVKNLPWAWYVSPFGGATAKFKVGREQVEMPGMTAYGMWAVPKNGAQVIVGFLDGNPEHRYYIGCIFMPEHNRTLPAGIDDERGMLTEIDESGYWGQDEIPTYKKNQTEAGLYKGSKYYLTRGSYERSVSHPSNKNKKKPNDNGYYPKPLEKGKDDSQTYSITSPGKHYILMSDVDEYCRMRIRTTEGNQIILDDTNERIYISTARGRNWIEIDEGSGKIYFYTSSKFSIHSENDLNLYSSENINIVAKKRVNIQSEERAVKIQSKHNIELLSTDANIKLTASRDIHLLTTNGPKASAVAEKTTCNKPPYSGSPLGYIRDYAEEGGSSTSKIFINAVNGVDVRANDGPIKITAKANLNLKSISGAIFIRGSTTVNTESELINLRADKMIMITGKPVIISTEIQAPGAPAAVADQAKKVSEDGIKVKMIVPLHETKPYIRDEDEDKCKTPRNKSYQDGEKKEPKDSSTNTSASPETPEITVSDRSSDLFSQHVTNPAFNNDSANTRESPASPDWSNE